MTAMLALLGLWLFGAGYITGVAVIHWRWLGRDERRWNHLAQRDSRRRRLTNHDDFL